MYDPNQRTRDARPLYDTYTLAVATAVPTDVTMFAEAVGTNSKSAAQTNMPRPYQIGVGQVFLMRALRLACTDMLKSDIVNVIKNFYFTFVVNDVDRLEAPLDFWPGGAGIAGLATATDILALSNGVPDPSAVAMIPSSDEIRINGDDTIKLKMRGTTFTTATAALGGTGIHLRAYLDGFWEKP